MTIHDLYTILSACDRARAREQRRKREADERLAAIEALRAEVQARLAAQR